MASVAVTDVVCCVDYLVDSVLAAADLAAVAVADVIKDALAILMVAVNAVAAVVDSKADLVVTVADWLVELLVLLTEPSQHFVVLLVALVVLQVASRIHCDVVCFSMVVMALDVTATMVDTSTMLLWHHHKTRAFIRRDVHRAAIQVVRVTVRTQTIAIQRWLPLLQTRRLGVVVVVAEPTPRYQRKVLLCHKHWKARLFHPLEKSCQAKWLVKRQVTNS